jgi:hypothetical protein
MCFKILIIDTMGCKNLLCLRFMCKNNDEWRRSKEKLSNPSALWPSPPSWEAEILCNH